jgi:hypothetical protein
MWRFCDTGSSNEELAPEEIFAATLSINADASAVDIVRMFGVRRVSAAAKNRIDKAIGLGRARRP